jgi:hypothetical protein
MLRSSLPAKVMLDRKKSIDNPGEIIPPVWEDSLLTTSPPGGRADGTPGLFSDALEFSDVSMIYLRLS